MIKIEFKDKLYLFLFALPNTVLNFCILYIINNVISKSLSFNEFYTSWCFYIIVFFTYILNIIFQKKLNKRVYNILYENEKRIFSRILNTKLITLEKNGMQKFYTVVEDLRTFAILPEIITHTINSLFMLILCLIYMFCVSFYAGLSVSASIIIISSIYYIIMNSMSKSVIKLRLLNEEYYKFVNDAIRGFKNLKVNAILSKNLLHKYLIPNRDQAKILDYNVNYVFLSINLISQYGLYIVIGIILFLLPQLNIIPSNDVVSYIVIVLFMISPISNIINMQNTYTRLSVAGKRINTFLIDFANEEEEYLITEEESYDFESIIFENISFQYENEREDNPFALNNINLKINRGEIIFIIGGNGSGKSTFINILTGLYEHKSGKILFNNESLYARDKLKKSISPIFTDNYIFSHNYENYTLENNKKYEFLLKLTEMNNIVTDTKDESARRSFSKGQSKRMSLIFALLEEKPIMVLDEWAADQDPHFRKYFYEKLIPQFKAQGKTIIAVTHDDAYFKFADRIIKFDNGRIVKNEYINTGTII